MSNTVIVDRDQQLLVVEPRGLDKMWSFTSRLEIPLAHVRGATQDDGAMAAPKGIRGPGLGLPKKFSGTWTLEGEKHFWNVSGPTELVVIELVDEHYARLFLTVADARALVDEINDAVG